jgi:hypothetical protein
VIYYYHIGHQVLEKAHLARYNRIGTANTERTRKNNEVYYDYGNGKEQGYD